MVFLRLFCNSHLDPKTVKGKTRGGGYVIWKFETAIKKMPFKGSEDIFLFKMLMFLEALRVEEDDSHLEKKSFCWPLPFQGQSAFPRSPESARKAGRKSKERIDASGLKEVRGAKIANMLRECLQIANFRLLETAREVSEKISASLQNTGMPSVWPADVVPLHSAPSVSSLDLESFVPSKRGVTHALPVQWFQVKLVKVHAFNERLERRRFKSSISNHNDPDSWLWIHPGFDLNDP